MDGSSAISIEAMPCAAAWLDEERRIIAHSGEFGRRLGGSGQRLTGQCLDALVCPQSRVLLDSVLWPGVLLGTRVDEAVLAFPVVDHGGPEDVFWATATLAREGGVCDGRILLVMVPTHNSQLMLGELAAARASLALIPDAVLQCHRGGDGALAFRFANDRVLDLLGVTARQMLDAPDTFWNALQASDRVAALQVIDHAEASGETTWSVQLHPLGKPTRVLEWSARWHALSHSWHAVLRDITERAMLEQELHRQSRTDALTGLPNRTALMQGLQQQVDGELPFAVLLMDLDRFKQVNDVLGHDAGDELLLKSAARLRQCLQARALVPWLSELQPTGAEGAGGVVPRPWVARLGGDEFVVVAEGVHTKEAAGELAARINQALSAPYRIGGREIRCSGTIGIALSGPGMPVRQLLRDADTAMYEAKRVHRGGHTLFEPALYQVELRKMELEADLRTALRNRQLRVAYQPIVDIDSTRVLGMEALARWHHPQYGEIPPVHFIPLAEECGLISELGEYILRMACEQFAGWRRAGLPLPPRLSVNLSRAQLYTADLHAHLRHVVESSGLDCSSVQLEITESLAMPGRLGRATLHQLRDSGFALAIDDFGTEYSCLATLQQLPLQQIKIDRSFITSIDTNRYHRALVQAVMQVSTVLGVDVVAEGVETQAQARTLQALGYRRAQGFLYARPLEAGVVPAFLVDRSDIALDTAGQATH